MPETAEVELRDNVVKGLQKMIRKNRLPKSLTDLVKRMILLNSRVDGSTDPQTWAMAGAVAMWEIAYPKDSGLNSGG